ncbi:MAG: aminotransferase class IV [Puniceicoccales bacterium]|jgi:branched-chain amino acid aminotransferase|nr:aminotransferase class IV [Puniceicoccales bacterium]
MGTTRHEKRSGTQQKSVNHTQYPIITIATHYCQPPKMKKFFANSAKMTIAVQSETAAGNCKLGTGFSQCINKNFKVRKILISIFILSANVATMKVYINGALYDGEDARISVLGNSFLKSIGVRDYFICRDGKFLHLNQRLEQLKSFGEELGMSFPWSMGDIKEALAVSYDMNQFEAKDALLTLILCDGGEMCEEKTEKVADGNGSADDEEASKETEKKKTAHKMEAHVQPSLIVIPEAQENREILLSPMKMVSVKEFPMGAEILQWEKHYLSQVGHVLLKCEAKKKETDGVILLDAEGNVSGCSEGDLFLIQGKTIFVPELRRDDVLTALIHSLIEDDELKVMKRKLSLRDIGDAEEAFVFSSFKKIIPLASIDKDPIGKKADSAITKTIAADLSKKIQGECGEAF